MNNKVKNNTHTNIIDDLEKKKTCFIVMPISERDDYPETHFKRVYEHLIKPAATSAGYSPVRADEVNSSNYIVIDILKRIVESDLVICDISTRNPNVLYELGIRHAFNLPTVLIKDDKTDRIFDIQGLRTLEYDHTLRIDNVQRSIQSISNAISETINNTGKDINSLIQLLSIPAATIQNQVAISEDTTLVLNALRDVTDRLSKIERSSAWSVKSKNITAKYDNPRSLRSIQVKGAQLSIDDDIYVNGDYIGMLIGIDSDGVYLKSSDGLTKKIGYNDPLIEQFSTLPF